MANSSKRFGASDTGLRSKNVDSVVWRLTGVYSLVILTVIVVINVAVYLLYNRGFAQNLATETRWEEREHVSQEELSEIAGEELVEALVVIDIGVLVLVIVASRFLSAEALRPLGVAYREQRRFLGDVAHELRTPLTVMKTGLEADKAAGRDYPSITESVEQIDHMARIVDDLIFLTKNETEAPRAFTRVSLGDIIRRETDALVRYAADKQVTLSCSTEGWSMVRGDEHDLARLVKNLVKNAIDYNRRGGTVGVRTAFQSGTVVLSIIDTGIGMAPEAHARIFERFFRLDTGHSSGSGLGLSIVKSIVDMHGARISVESILGRGTTFTVVFRAA